jgi:serine/threonine protein phosphatase 1
MKNFMYAVADLHGRSDLFKMALREINTDAIRRKLEPDEYRIIQLGDRTDRGPNSREVVEICMSTPKIENIMGNHEAMLLYMFDPKTCKPYEWSQYTSNRLVRSHLQNGGIETLESYGYEFDPKFNKVDYSVIPESHINWLLSLPYFVRTKYHFFVHAGLRASKTVENQDPEDMIWIRHEFIMAADCATPPAWSGLCAVHGHTPRLDYDVEIKHNRVNLDTGSVWSGRQAIGVFDLDKPGVPLEVLWVEKQVSDKLWDPYESLDSIILKGPR